MKKLVSILLVAIMLLGTVASFASCGEKVGVKVIDIPLSVEEYAFAVAKEDTELLASVNA